MENNRKMEISGGVSLLGRLLTDREASRKWRLEHAIKDKMPRVSEFKRIKVKSLCLVATQLNVVIVY